MSNTGYKQILTLRKYVNGSATSETKTNVNTDPDYIAPYVDYSSCPIYAGYTTTSTTQGVVNGVNDAYLSLVSEMDAAYPTNAPHAANPANTAAYVTLVGTYTYYLKVNYTLSKAGEADFVFEQTLANSATGSTNGDIGNGMHVHPSSWITRTSTDYSGGTVTLRVFTGDSYFGTYTFFKEITANIP